MMKKYAVITGASQGLGRSFAYELAKRGNNLVLISLPGQNLQILGEEIRLKSGVEVVCFERDFSKTEQVLEVASFINKQFDVNLLINNAGVGGTKVFTHADTEYILRIIQVNVMATSLFTHQLLPSLMKQQRGFILNVSSLAAFSPVGYKTIYPASKAFIHSFSRGLCEELKNTGVFVSVVNPGPMATNADVRDRIKNHGIFGRMTVLDPDKVAKKCIDKIYRRDTVIMVNPVSWLTLKLLPVWIMLPLLTRSVKKELSHSY